MTRIAVLGAGAWGTTLADLLANNGHAVCLWDRSDEKLQELRRTRSPAKPPGLVMHDSVTFDPDFSSAVADAEIVVCVVASSATRDMCLRLRQLPSGIGNRVFVSCAKGIEDGTLMLPSQIFDDVFRNSISGQFAVLAGPSHAEEVSQKLPTVVVCGSTSLETAERVQELFMTPRFRVYTQTDCFGVELGGALKNVIAIAAGACDGMGYGDNTKAALITRGLAEMARMARAVGAQMETLAGLAGLGDLIVTTMSRHSRNRGFGELIAKGRSVDEALREIGAVVEGYGTARTAYLLSQKVGVEMPLTEGIYRTLYEGMDIREVTESLLARNPKPEIY